jgi:hypothetical protein
MYKISIFYLPDFFKSNTVGKASTPFPHQFWFWNNKNSYLHPWGLERLNLGGWIKIYFPNQVS